jgi:hypothetical protein
MVIRRTMQAVGLGMSASLAALGLFVLAPVSASAQYGDPLPESGAADTLRTSPRELDVISLGLEVVPSPAEGSFFDQYDRLGGKATQIDPTTILAMTIRVVMNDAFWLAFSGGYMRVGFDEHYEVRTPAMSDSMGVPIPLASVNEEFRGSVLPLMGGIEWTPVRSQFTSYVGASGGLAVTSLSWTSASRPSGVDEFYRPVTNTSGIGVAPAVRVFAGVDLRFDYFSTVGGPFRGIYVEGAYFYLPLSRNYFKELRQTGQGIPVLPAQDRATVNAGGLTLTIGLNVQFPRQ